MLRRRTMKLIAKNAVFLLLLFPLLSVPAYSGPEKLTRFSLFLEGTNYSAAEREAIKQRVMERLQSKGPERTEIKDVRGDIVSTAACPIGYVRKANYQFSTKEISIIRDEGVDCDTAGQCRAWQVDAKPKDKVKPYDFSLQLQCSADDTLPRRNKAELDTVVTPSALKKSKG